MSTAQIITTSCTRGLFDWTIEGPDGLGYLVTGGERPLPDDPDTTPATSGIVFGVGPAVRPDAPPKGWLHRKPTEDEDNLPTPPGYPLDQWANPDVQGSQWPLAVAPDLRGLYLEAAAVLPPATSDGPTFDVQERAHWPHLSKTLCDKLPAAYRPRGEEWNERGRYWQYAPTPALIDHQQRLAWAAARNRAQAQAPTARTCRTCGTTWTDLPQYTDPECRPCRDARALLHRTPGLFHLIRNADLFTA